MSASPITPGSVTHSGCAARDPSGPRKAAAGDAVGHGHQPADSIAKSPPATPTLRDAALARSGVAADARSEDRREVLVQALLAKVPAGDRAAARTAIPAILDAARTTGNTDPNQLGYLLATAQTESDFGANMVENGHPRAWFDTTYGGEDGNRPGTSDGYAFRGRGYVQTTHAGRYAELSHRLGLPDVPVLDCGKPMLDARGKAKMEPALIADPDRLAEPRLAAQALVFGVKHNLFTQNAAAAIDKTIPAGKKPGEVDFYHARGIVNGIVKAQAQAVASHATDYAQILMGYRHSVLAEPRAK